MKTELIVIENDADLAEATALVRTLMERLVQPGGDSSVIARKCAPCHPPSGVARSRTLP